MGIVGSLIALFVEWTGDDGVYAKSMILSGFVWFAIHALGAAFRLPVVRNVGLGTLITHLLEALVFGALWPVAMRWFEPKVRT